MDTCVPFVSGLDVYSVGQQTLAGTSGFDHTQQLAGGHAHSQSSDEQPKTLHLKNVPEHVNNPPTLRKHFSQFGEIVVLDCQPGKRFATVGFTTRVSLCTFTYSLFLSTMLRTVGDI